MPFYMDFMLILPIIFLFYFLETTHCSKSKVMLAAALSLTAFSELFMRLRQFLRAQCISLRP